MRNLVINTLKHGGFNLTDTEKQIKALRLSWIPRVLDERKGTWKSYFNFIDTKAGQKKIDTKEKCRCFRYCT